MVGQNKGYKNTNGSQICIWFPFHSLATVVAKSRQATVIMTDLQGRSLVNPFADRRIDQLASVLPEDTSFAQLLTTSTAFSGTLRFPFRISVRAEAFPVFQFTVRSENRENSINTCLAIPVTHIHASGLPRPLMIKSFKELSGLLSLTW